MKARARRACGGMLALGLSGAIPSIARADDAESESDKQACIESHAYAQQLRIDKALLEAKQQLLSCARDACPALVRQACSNLLTDVQLAIPTMAITVARSTGEAITDASMTVDGEPWPDLGSARDIDPGVHEIRVEHATHGRAERTVTIIEGKKNQLVEIELGAAPPPVDRAPIRPESPRGIPPTGAFVLWGFSLVGAGVGAALGGISVGLENDVRTQDDLDTLQAYRLGADISFITAGALLAGGVVWWVIDAAGARPADPAAATPLRAVAVPSPNGAHVFAVATF